MERPGKKSRGLYPPPFGRRCRLFNIGPQAELLFLRVGLVYWGLTPQQQAGLYGNGGDDDDDDDDGGDDDDDEMSVFTCRPKLEPPFKNPVSASQIIYHTREYSNSLYIADILWYYLRADVKETPCLDQRTVLTFPNSPKVKSRIQGVGGQPPPLGPRSAFFREQVC